MLVIFAGWEAVGSFRLAGLSWPPLTAVLYLADSTRTPLFVRAVDATLAAVAIGYAFGCVVGLALAMITHVMSVLRPGTDRAMAVIHAIPSIALGPLFIVLLSRDATPVAIASLNVLFALYVAGISGLASASKAHLDVMHALGAPLVRQLLLAVPAALIGDIIGEWFGAPRGLGLLIVSAMQNFQILLLWSTVLLTALVSLTLFGALTLLERLVYERFH